VSGENLSEPHPKPGDRGAWGGGKDGKRKSTTGKKKLERGGPETAYALKHYSTFWGGSKRRGATTQGGETNENKNREKAEK